MRIALLCVLLAGCSKILGIGEATVEGGDDTPVTDAPGSADAAEPDAFVCVPANCTFGCDTTTNMCRPGKLYVFETMGGFQGNAFGGTDVPPNVRGGADAKCLITYDARHTARECARGNVHAILHVSGTDSIPGMATTYRIPTNVPVHRAADDVVVFNTWPDLTDPAVVPRAAVTTAPTEAEGIVWTGANTTEHCTNWTSPDALVFGTRGYTTRLQASWKQIDTLRCDRTSRLLCVCWTGP